MSVAGKWSAENEMRLRELWLARDDDGRPAHSLNDLAGVFDLGAGAIQMKVKRLGLPARLAHERPKPKRLNAAPLSAAKVECQWPDKMVAKLRALWADGLSASSIGKTMGLSKNAVMGKAHRLGLPSRPSPIKASSPDNRRAKQAWRDGTRGGSAMKRTLRHVARTEPLPFERAAPTAAEIDAIESGIDLAVVAPVVAVLAAPTMRGTCQWIADHGPWMVRGREPMWCGAPTQLGQSWCAVHRAVVWARRTAA